MPSAPVTSHQDAPVALVTGAAKRIGATIARTLHDRGYDVAIHYHTSQAPAAMLADELNAARAGSAFVVAQDLAAPDAARALIAAMQARRGRLDLLVNNASIFERMPPDRMTVEHWERMQAINLRTPYFLSMHGAALLGRAQGSIVNIADIHAERPRIHFSAYCTSKAGVIAMTRALALDFAPAVRVNCVSPGAILWAATEDARVRNAVIQSTPLKRCGEPQDIAEAVCYLAGARFVTGHVLHVDGGRLFGGGGAPSLD